MVTGDRQRIMETNRSLRVIKNELETLLEKGVLTDTAYDSISALLPGEASISSSAAATATSGAHSQNRTFLTSQPSLPIRKASPAIEPVANPPPAYTQAAVAAPPGPILPPRKTTQPAAPEKPVLCKARALYKYAAQDSRDCSFDKEDVVLVYEYMNADWWMGRNSRTNAEGIFPRNYVEEMPSYDEKAGHGNAVAASGYPPPPPAGTGNSYNNNSNNNNNNNDGGPTDAGEEGDKDNKGQDMGKKFGKKLGNAAIFGAGATMGSKIVSSIF